MIPEKSVTAVMGLSRSRPDVISRAASPVEIKLCIQTARLRGNYDDQRRNKKEYCFLMEEWEHFFRNRDYRQENFRKHGI